MRTGEAGAARAQGAPPTACGHGIESGGAHAGARAPALERAALVLAQAAPDAVVLTRLQRPGKALLAHVAATAHLLGLLDLEDGRAGVADGEEQLWVLVEASRTVAPIHGFAELSFGWGNYFRARGCERFHERILHSGKESGGKQPLGRFLF